MLQKIRDLGGCGSIQEQKRKEKEKRKRKDNACRCQFMRSQVLYRAAQDSSMSCAEYDTNLH